MNQQFSGGPESARVTLARWLRPRGGPIVDGARLAVINTAGLIAAVLWVAVVTIVTRLIDRYVPVPIAFTGFIAALIAVMVGAVVWYRYGAAHGVAARAGGADPRPDVFGVIAAGPFIAVGVALLSFGLVGLFFAAITFSGSRFGDALRQLVFAALFLGVGAASVVVARASSGGSTGGA
ncbi:MAG TPA: hypothetical protein VMM78_07865 [Thermomicrobiales bacterium]|nr:hypothetical protein [Thermomicrobiales bacterium]